MQVEYFLSSYGVDFSGHFIFLWCLIITATNTINELRYLRKPLYAKEQNYNPNFPYPNSENRGLNCFPMIPI
jgi:hypothetical protein